METISGIYLYTTPKGKFSVFKAHIQEVMFAYEGRGNPALWFVKDLQTNDYPVLGVKTKRQALEDAGLGRFNPTLTRKDER